MATARNDKRTTILDSVEALMLEQGYAAVTYRAVAARAGVVPGLVQYYFPTQDELFVAMLQRSTARVIEQIEATAQSEQPLRAIWSYASNKTGATMLLEFMALAHHREAVRAELGRGGDRVRRAQLQALKARWADYDLDDRLSPGAVLFMMNAIPRMALLEEAFGTRTGHAEALALIQGFLDEVEPKRHRRKRAASS